MKNAARPRRSVVALVTLILTGVLGVFSPMAQAQAEPTLAPNSGDLVSALTVTQHFTQPAGVGASGAFAYELTALPGADGRGDLPSGADGSVYRFLMDGEATADPFGGISFTRPGVFTYGLRQVNAGLVGYTYDATEYRVTVEVANREDGGFAVVAVVAQVVGGDKVGSLVFSCLYALDPTDPLLMTDPPVNKTVQGPASHNETWEFDLTALDPANPMPAGSVDGVKAVFVTGSGSTEFGQWSYAAVGTYVYTVTEKDTGVVGYAYDGSVYTITDYVTPGEGRLVLTRVVTNSLNKNVASFDFVNEFDHPVTATPGPSVITGGALLGPAGTNALPFVVLMVVALLGAGVCLFLVWKRRKKDDDETVAPLV